MKKFRTNYFNKLSYLRLIKMWSAIMLLCLGATACVPGPPGHPGPPGPGPLPVPHMLP